MKPRGTLLVILGILGTVYIALHDILVGKPYHIGLKSSAGFIGCAFFVLLGISILKKKT
ncbi:hypothetical protein ACFL38_04620 [Candidatus Omnitrophota bacterium]